MFDEAVIRLPEGGTFKVTVSNNSAKNKYVQALYMRGKKYDKSFILHTDILKGGEMKIVMGAKPNYAFGAKPEDRPQ
jgi:putative alpha-1,2-mannosidase